MKSAMLSLSVLASVTTLAGSATAAERVHVSPVTPSAATMQAVTTLIGAHGSDLTVYPTANGQVVFVSYRTDDGEHRGDHVGLIQVRHGRVSRFADFSGAKPRNVVQMSVERTGDAQAQARALLVAATTPVTPAVTMPAVSSTQARVSVQSQAAELLRAAPAARHPVEPLRRVARSNSGVRSDSQSMARAVLTASVGE